MLGVNHCAVHKVLQMREDVQECALGWEFVRTKGHSDSVELNMISEWLHTEGTAEDNANKRKHRADKDAQAGRVGSSATLARLLGQVGLRSC